MNATTNNQNKKSTLLARQGSNKTELEHLKDNELFWNSDPQIAAAKKRARTLADAFNATTEEEPQKRLALLKELFGSCDDDIFIKPPFHCDYGFNIHVGKNFFANFQCVMLDAAPITVGDNCLMGPQTCLYTVNHPMDVLTRTANYVYGEPITIGDNVWFGGNCIVLSGVTIGSNAIIGAGSVVTSDVPENAVVAGNPAKVLRIIDHTPVIRKATLQDLDTLASIEAACFPPAEAASKQAIAQRLAIYCDHFWLLEAQGAVISFINGMTTDEATIRDEMYAAPDLHNPQGKYQAIFGVNTLPAFRRQGCAATLMQRVISDAKQQGRQGCILTCKEALIHYYAKFGFENCGQSQSTHGGAVWYDMRLCF